MSNNHRRGLLCLTAIVAVGAITGCGSGSSASTAPGAVGGDGSSSATAAAQSTAVAAGTSVDSLSCDMFTKESLDAAVAAQLPGATVLTVTQTLKEAGRLDCEASFPPASEGAMGIAFSIQDGYFDTSGYMPASRRPDAVAAFQAERQTLASKTYASDAPYVETLFDAPDFGADAYFRDTVYALSDGHDGGISTELVFLRANLPFFVQVKFRRAGTTAVGDVFTQIDARHALVTSVANALLATIGP